MTTVLQSIQREPIVYKQHSNLDKFFSCMSIDASATELWCESDEEISEEDAPNLLEDYDAIGFEADHCLVEFNRPAYKELTVKCYLDGLKELNYPIDGHT